MTRMSLAILSFASIALCASAQANDQSQRAQTWEGKTGCFWYPWWGYICGPVVPTTSSTDFNYGVGAGIRWDVNRQFFLKGGVDQHRVDFSSSGTPEFTVWRLDFGSRF